MWPVENSGKTEKILKVGTYLANNTNIDSSIVNSSASVNVVKGLHNDLLAVPDNFP